MQNAKGWKFGTSGYEVVFVVTRKSFCLKMYKEENSSTKILYIYVYIYLQYIKDFKLKLSFPCFHRKKEAFRSDVKMNPDPPVSLTHMHG